MIRTPHTIKVSLGGYTMILTQRMRKGSKADHYQVCILDDSGNVLGTNHSIGGLPPKQTRMDVRKKLRQWIVNWESYMKWEVNHPD